MRNISSGVVSAIPCTARIAGSNWAQKHRTVDHEMVIVLAVAGIDVERAPLLIELEVGLDRRLIPVHHVLVMPAQNIYVRRHVDQVSGIGH